MEEIVYPATNGVELCRMVWVQLIFCSVGRDSKGESQNLRARLNLERRLGQKENLTVKRLALSFWRISGVEIIFEINYIFCVQKMYIICVYIYI